MSWLPVLAALPPGVVVLRDYHAGYSLVECSHAEREGLVCPFCRGTSDQPEKRLAIVPAAQLTLG